MNRAALVSGAGAVTVLLAIAAAADAPPAPPLQVRVLDPGGLPIAGATVRMPSTGVPLLSCTTDASGECLLRPPHPPPWRLRVAAEGFEVADVTRARAPARPGLLEVHLRIARVTETVEVSAPGPFTTVLTPDDLAALPDDPEEFRAALEALAGPGAVIRVNGFRAGRLPSKAAIADIRLRTNPFRADSHELADAVIDIRTKPGAARWGGRLGAGHADSALASRPAFTAGPAGDDHTRGRVFLEGPVASERTSFSLDAGWSDRTTAKGLTAAGPRADPDERAVASSSENADATLSVDQALGSSHAIRIEYAADHGRNRGLGIGGLDLPERSYVETATTHELRLSAKSDLGPHSLNEARLRIRITDTSASPASRAPAVDVLDVFRGGGAQVEGATRMTELELADDWDFALARRAGRVGFLLERATYRSDRVVNRTGTFTFSTLDDFLRGQPSLFTRRLGDPTVSFTQTRLGLYAQTDFRAGRDLSVGLGVRTEFQDGLGGLTLGPRVTVAWTPAGGSTTLRAAAGRFTDWLGVETEAEAARLAGPLLEEVVSEPTYPDPGPGTTRAFYRRLDRAADLRLPTAWRAQLALETRALPGATMSLRYGFGWGARQFRTRALSAGEPAGTNPPALWQLESAARSWSQRLEWSAIYVLPHRARAYATYAWAESIDEADGPFALPADSEHPETDRGPARDDVRHRFFALGSVRILHGLWAGLQVHASSGIPYNVTTGRDANGDAVFSDRPAGLGRNSGRGAATIDVGTRLSWTMGFGPARQPDGGVQTRHSEGMGSAEAIRQRFSLEIYAQATNLFNRFNPIGFVGVQASPLAGRPTSARSARHIELGFNIGF